VTLQQLVSQLLERGNAMQTFWGFYITVSLGLIAFFGSSKRPKRLAGLVSIAFVAFAYVNVDGMADIAAQRQFLWKQLDFFISQSHQSGQASYLPESVIAEGIKHVAEPPAPEKVKKFHFGCDFAVLAAIWFLALWQSNSSGNSEQSKTKAPRKLFQRGKA